ncbi:MAG: hypothetical protein U0361_02165 [Nitrospiraceae bacterium]
MTADRGEIRGLDLQRPVPRPVVRVTEGEDTIKFTPTNPATNNIRTRWISHAAEIDFLKNYKAINAGETITQARSSPRSPASSSTTAARPR